MDLAVICRPGGRGEAAVDDCVATGVAGDRRDHGGLLRDRRGGPPPRGGAPREGPRGRDPDGRAQLHGPHQHRSAGPPERARSRPVYPPEGRVALSSQSGALGLALLDYAAQLNLGISTFVSVGNKADVSGNDLIQYWAEDPRTDVILLYLESFGNPAAASRGSPAGSRARSRSSRSRPGRSRAGARAASRRTRARSPSRDAVVDALFRQAGVIRTGTLEELFDVATLLAHQPVPRGPPRRAS